MSVEGADSLALQYKVASNMPLSRLSPFSRLTSRTAVGPGLRAAMMLGAIALAVVLYAGSSACDSTARITPQKLLFDDLRVVSAYPAKLDSTSGDWVRACGDDHGTGLMVNVALVSTQRTGGDDTDHSIRPGDVVNLRVVDGPLDDDIQVKPGTVTLDLDCLDKIPDDNLSACQGTTGAGIPLNSPDVTYSPYANLDDDASLKDRRDQARTMPHNVMLLIDQSGSMGGLVNLSTQPVLADDCETDDDCVDASDPNNQVCFNGFCAYTNCICGETCTCKEDDPGVVNATVGGQKFGDYGSDYFNKRITAARSFIQELNSRDRLGVLAFGEGISGEDLVVGCNDTFGAVDEDLKRCFGRDRDKVLQPGPNDATDPLSALDSGKGRSNMWSAVKVAYDFLHEQALSRPKETYHIVVLTDGPDTCSVTDDFGACQVACSTANQDTILNLVNTDLLDPKAPRIHIHFVQFESKGHQGRDPRQVEVACVTGGHYQFVNTVKGFANAQPTAFIEALETALFNVRYSLMGNWMFSGAVPSWELSAASGTAPGSMYALSGQFTITDASRLQPELDKQTFGVGKGVGAKDASSWDRRPTLLKPCLSAVDCGADADPDANSCSIICSSDTRLCPDGANGVDRTDNTSCTTSGGQNGACCGGECQTGLCEFCPQ